jgi:catechol 2,3-dioxygenase-like lactoylglutathione lyase family enzyme
MLGFELERRLSPAPGTDIAHVVDANGTRIELLRRDASAPGPDTSVDAFEAILVRGAKHVGFLVESADDTGRTLNDLGAVPLAEPVDVPTAGVRNCWVRDPDGTQVEFNELASPVRQEQRSRVRADAEAASRRYREDRRTSC